MKLTGKETEGFHLADTTETLATDEASKNAMGGTEMMKHGLYNRLSPDIRDKFQIICSRVREVDPNRPSILWLHDTWDDPEAQHLKDPKSRERFRELVFVSYYQFWSYHLAHGVPYSDSIVLRNAIEPIAAHEKPKEEDTINLIYHTTPHRGLEILVPVVDHLAKNMKGHKIHLDVYSSFKVYGWDEQDSRYNDLYEKIDNHPNMTYHGAQPNDVVRKALEKAHIFAYPSIWPETACIAAMEAMSAGCLVVCPNYGALPETTANFAMMYPWEENHNMHANLFAQVLKKGIEKYWMPGNQDMLKYQQGYSNTFYSWDSRIPQWGGLLNGILTTDQG